MEEKEEKDILSSEISTDKTTCKNNMVHAIKYDGSSACVKSSTLSKLTYRGWTFTDAVVAATDNSNISTDDFNFPQNEYVNQTN